MIMDRSVHTAHVAEDSLIGGVYYVTVPKNSGNLQARGLGLRAIVMSRHRVRCVLCSFWTRAALTL